MSAGNVALHGGINTRLGSRKLWSPSPLSRSRAPHLIPSATRGSSGSLSMGSGEPQRSVRFTHVRAPWGPAPRSWIVPPPPTPGSRRNPLRVSWTSWRLSGLVKYQGQSFLQGEHPGSNLPGLAFLPAAQERHAWYSLCLQTASHITPLRKTEFLTPFLSSEK